MAQTIKVKRGNKVDFKVLSVGEPALATDSREFFIGTSAGTKNLSVFSVRGGDLTVAPSSWLADGDGLAVTISDPKVPAEDDFAEYQVSVSWAPDSLKSIPSTIITDTIATGGSYKLILLSEIAPDEPISGQVVISKISKDW